MEGAEEINAPLSVSAGALEAPPPVEPLTRAKVLYGEEVPWPAPRILLPRVARLGAFSAGLGALLLSKIPLCPFAIFTGQPCPGCGLTRATLASFHGHFIEAFHLHPLVFVASPAAIMATLLGAYSYLKVGRTRFSPGIMRWLLPPLKVLYVLMLGVWMARFFGLFGGPVAVTDSIFSLTSHIL